MTLLWELDSVTRGGSLGRAEHEALQGLGRHSGIS